MDYSATDFKFFKNRLRQLYKKKKISQKSVWDNFIKKFFKVDLGRTNLIQNI